MLSLTYVSPTCSDMGGWKARHLRAVQSPMHPVARALASWISYADEHARRFGSQIGEDYVLGPAWARWGLALRELLNGDLGQMDGGTLDTIIHTNLTEQGYYPDTM